MSDADIAMRATLDTSGAASGFQSLNGHLNDFGIKTNTASASLGPLGTVLGSLASPLSLVALGAGAVGTALAGSVQAAAAWETSMSGVAKTTGLAGPELAALSQELLTMSSNMPTAAAELGQIAEVAGSLGVAKENIAGFTEAAAMMAVGFAMPAEQAATQAAKILTAFGKPIDTANMMALGNVVNTMGDNFAATEAQVLDFVSRASYLNTTFGMGIPAVAAWGTALISVGVDSEVAATGIKSMMNLSLDPKKFDAFAKAAGMSASELKEALNKDVAGTYEMVAEKIAGGTDAVEKFGTISKLVGTEGMTVFTKMGGAAYQSQEALAKANAEWTNGSSLMKTYETQSATVNSQWVIFTNTLNQAGVQLGTVLLPAVSDILEMMTLTVKAGMDVADTLGEWGDQIFGKEAEAAVLDFFGATGNANRTNEISAKEMATQTADVYSDYLGQGIAGHEGEMAAAMGGTLGGDAALEAAQKAGEDTAKAFTDEQEAYMKSHSSGGYSISTMQQMQSQASDTEYIPDTYGSTKIGGFDFVLDKDNVLRLPDGTVEPFTGTKDLNNRLYSYIEKFTGAAMTDIQKAELLGDVKKQVQLNAKLELKADFDYTGILEPLKGRMENEGNVIAQIGSKTAVDAYKDLLEQSKAPMLENLGKVLDDIAILAKERPLAASEYMLFGDDFKATVAAQIYDAMPVIETKMKELGDAAKTAFNGEFTQDERALLLAYEPQLQLLKQTFPEEFKTIGGDASLALIAAIKAGDIPGALALIGKDSGAAFKTALFGELKGSLAPTLAEIIANPDLEKSIGSTELFLRNTFLPGLKNDMGSMNDLYNTGFGENQTVVKNYVEGLEKLLGSHRDWFAGWQADLLTMYKNNTIDLEALLDIWNQMEGASTKTTEKIKDQTVGYDNLKKSIEDCADCAVSEFGQWQEAQDGLFQDSYIGQGGQAYLDWKTAQVASIAATQEAMRAAGGAVLGQDYTQSLLLDQQIKIDADMSGAEASKAAFESTIAAAKPEMSLQIETQAAMDEVNRLVSYIITVNPVMSVQVSVSAYADEIYAMVDSAIRSALA
jgi:TP901 family phage tail tape measure protein